ncbi:MAG: TonB-dependent Receptor Plug Domain protein [bacterium ADurb.Bin243]|nr:MAG: TonB-dependent Receptor Plug Domain protein [bacterium ADurb.Bin243]
MEFIKKFEFTSRHGFVKTAAVKLAAAFFVLAFAAGTVPAAAAEWKNGAIKNDRAIELNPISVMGEKIYDPIAEPTAVPLNNSTFTESIDRKAIELRNPFTATELISFISPSVLRSNQNRKYRSFFDIRGSKVSLILDGFVVQDGSSNSGMRGDDRLLEFLNPDIIESVEVMKDSTALIYGGAKGGTIYIRTRKPEKKHNRLKLELGTFGEFTTKLSLTDIIDKKSAYFAAFNHRKFDGPDGKNAAFNDTGAFLKYFYSPTKHDDFVFTYNSEIGMYQIPVDDPEASGQFKLVPGIDPKTYSIVIDPRYGWSYEPWKNNFSDLNYTKKWNSRQSTNFQLSRLEVTNDFHNPRGVGAAPVGHIDGHHVLETTNAMALRHTIKTGGGTIYRMGYSLDHWYNPTGKLYWEKMNNEDKKHTMYLQTEVPLSGDRLVLDAGYRRDRRYIIREQKSRTPAGKALAPITDQWEDPRNSVSTGLTWKVTKNDTLSLRYASLVMTPVDRKATQSGADLADETDKIINFGVEHKFKNISRPTSIELNIFRNDMKNSLVDDGTKFIDAAKTTVMRAFKNTDTVSRGGEIKLNTKLSELFDLSVGAGLASYSPDLTTKPKKNYIAELKYENGRSGISAGLYGRFVGSFDSSTSYNFKDAANKTTTRSLANYQLGNFWDLGFNVSKKLTPGDEHSPKISLTVRNLLDKKYETMPLAPDFGRRATLGYEIDF